jgi:hypothetical protein
MILEEGPVGRPETSVRIYHYSHVIAQKTAGLIYVAAEAWNQAETDCLLRGTDWILKYNRV